MEFSEASNHGSPIHHIHVKVVKRRRDKNGTWFALFADLAGQETWMEQPAEPIVGDEQVLYVIKHGTPEAQMMDLLISNEAPRQLVEYFMEGLAHHFGEWCDKTYEEAKKVCLVVH